MFTPQEQEIINYGLKNGKSQEEVSKAISNLRAGIKPVKEEAPAQMPEKHDLFVTDETKGKVIEALGSEIPKIPAPFKSDPTKDGAVGSALKTLGNLPTSAVNLATGIFDFLNPVKNTIDTVKNVTQTYKELSDYSKTTGEHPLTILGKAFTSPSGTKIPGTNLDNAGLSSAAAQVLIPKFIQQISSGDLEGATKSIVERPAEEIGPLVLIAKGVADKFGVGDKFDAAMAKVASPVEKPVRNLITKMTGANGKVVQQPTKLPTQEEFLKNPENYDLFRGENQGNKGGLSFSPDPNWSNKFKTPEGQMLSGRLPKGAKVKVLDQSDVNTIMQRFKDAPGTDPIWEGGNVDFQKYLNQQFFNQGYDAIIQSDSMNPSMIEVIVNPKILNGFNPLKVETSKIKGEDVPKDTVPVKTKVPTETKIPSEVKTTVPEGGTTFNKFGRRISETFIRPSEKTARMVQDYEAGVSNVNPITPADTAARLGIWGTDRQMGVQSTAKLDTLWKESIKPAVRSIKEKLTTEEVISELETYVRNERNLSRKADLTKELENIKEEFKNRKSATYETWQETKSSIDENTPSKVLAGDRASSVHADLQHQMADIIRRKTYEKLADQNVKQDYLDWGNLQKIKGEGAKAMAANVGNRPSFTNLIAQVIDHSIQPVMTGAGTLIYNVGDFKIATKVKIPKEVKTIQDYLNYLPKKVTLEDLMEKGVIYLDIQEDEEE